MDKIDNFMRHNPRYKSLSKPLQAAKVCDVARSLTQYHFEVISYRNGLLTLGVGSSAEAGNLQAQCTQIISEINKKLEQELVKRLRIKLI